MKDKIFTYDTTLRDGTQGEEVAFSADDKVKIAKRLDAFGIDYIEGGWPGSNPKDMEFFELAKKVRFTYAKLAAFGSTRRAKNPVQEDANIKALLDAQTPVVTIFGKAWLLHVKAALQISEEENLDIIEDSVRYLKKNGKEVVYDAEHFFDGYKSDKEYALKTLAAAERAGADVIVLCDTNGGTMPDDIAGIVRDVKHRVAVPLGIHTHNDSEVAVANALAAIQNGCVHVQGTINGYGERCGNANLCSIIPNLQLKLKYCCVENESLKSLTELSHYVSELANLTHRKNLAYVGESAFAHKGGVHVSAVMKNPETYEHTNPENVGNVRRVLVSDLSGRSNILYKAKELGINIDDKSPMVQHIVDDLKEMEHYVRAGQQGHRKRATGRALAQHGHMPTATDSTSRSKRCHWTGTDHTPHRFREIRIIHFRAGLKTRPSSNGDSSWKTSFTPTPAKGRRGRRTGGRFHHRRRGGHPLSNTRKSVKTTEPSSSRRHTLECPRCTWPPERQPGDRP